VFVDSNAKVAHTIQLYQHCRTLSHGVVGVLVVNSDTARLAAVVGVRRIHEPDSAAVHIVHVADVIEELSSLSADVHGIALNNIHIYMA